MRRPGRNEPCPCGSGQKFKRCHGRPDLPNFSHEPLAQLAERTQSDRLIRTAQQGLGRPIVSSQFGDVRLVAVKNKLYHSRAWKTFPDFLTDYLKGVLGREWGEAEISKPLTDRHVVMQWYDAYCRFQRDHITEEGRVSSHPVTGLVAAYLGVAYSLFLLEHNVELQSRLIQRLRNPGNFQGAYYELLVANILIRAGFELVLEDETDNRSKHCEFAAVSRLTGKRYWVEAKMRSVAGCLGKTANDGGSSDNPTARLVQHLNGALAKPAEGERLIFIDVNSDPSLDAQAKPKWLARVVKRLKRFEDKELKNDATAYVFITNLGFHRALDVKAPNSVALPYGLGIPDFNRPGHIGLSDAYRRKLKHSDAHSIGESFCKLVHFPATFDGSLPSETFGGRKRILVGDTYAFDGVDGVVTGTVTSATVSDREARSYVSVSAMDGRSLVFTSEMSEDQMADYRAHPGNYFGEVKLANGNMDDPFDFFEWLVKANKDRSRAQMTSELARAFPPEKLLQMPDDDLLYTYCEMLVSSILSRSARQPPAPCAPEP